jgi:AAA family ATP:ADP antiporter
MFMVNRWDAAQGSARGNKTAAAAEGALGGSMWDAFVQVFRSPYLLGIAGFIFLLTWVTTPLYIEQSTFAKHYIAADDDRTRFFANIDFWVQTASLLAQFLLFGHLFKWLGTRVLLVALPVILLVGYIVFAFQPIFAVVVWVYAIRRVVDYAITRPSRESLFTVVSRDEKYKAKSLIDTFVYRGGDATSATVLTQITKALPLSAVGWFGAAISFIWMLLAFGLGKAQERGQGEQAQSEGRLAGASSGSS